MSGPFVRQTDGAPHNVLVRSILAANGNGRFGSSATEFVCVEQLGRHGWLAAAVAPYLGIYSLLAFSAKNVSDETCPKR
jgi:hypothetical protein